MIPLNRILQGRILDIGGGGEGIIGRLYREQVIAIDCCQQELDDAPDGFEKKRWMPPIWISPRIPSNMSPSFSP